MKYFSFLLLGLTLAISTWGQAPATMPSAPEADSTDPLLGKLFRSRIDGIQFNPPAGGTLIRELNTGETVRFVYTDSSWDLRVKPIVLSKPMALSSSVGDGGLLELTASQFTATNQAAVILTQEVRPMAYAGAKVGLIEARYDAGTNVIFAQEAIVQDNNQHYFAVQMSSPGKPKNAPADAADPQETEARKIFRHVLATVQVLDRRALGEEQKKRIYQTRLLWVQIDRKKIVDALQPLHFMRVLQNGKDIGFIQVDERLASHNGREGVEYVVHSRVESGADQVMDAARSQPTPPVSDSGSATSIVVPKGLTGNTAAPAASGAPTNIYTTSTYFVTFDRNHEDWITTTQVDQQVGSQLSEMANSDRLEKLRLDPTQLATSIKDASKPRDRQPPTTQISDYSLDVSQYTHGGHVGKPLSAQLPPFYLPQMMGQMLPRLLPSDPAQYLFASYVSNQRNVMARYVEVEKPREVVLDDQTVRAIPISDRIGVDGIPTIHYVTRTGEWLGSVNEDSKLEVLPTDEKALKTIWKDSGGFTVCPPPPLAEEPAVDKKPASDNKKSPADLQPQEHDGR